MTSVFASERERHFSIILECLLSKYLWKYNPEQKKMLSQDVLKFEGHMEKRHTIVQTHDACKQWNIYCYEWNNCIKMWNYLIKCILTYFYLIAPFIVKLCLLHICIMQDNKYLYIKFYEYNTICKYNVCIKYYIITSFILFFSIVIHYINQ